MKYKVGEKVRVRKDLEVNKNYNDCRFDSDMKCFCGEIVTILKAFNCNGNDRYVIKGSSWRWANDMFTALKISINDLQFADILTLRNGEKYVYADGYMHGEKERYYHDCDIISDYYYDDLTREDNEQEYDVMRVERMGEVIFERIEEIKEMTVEEISKVLGYEVKIIKEKN